jgi:hypothetical protein
MASSDVDAALAGMAKVGAPRKPMGKDALAFTSPSAKPASGKLMPRGNKQAGDPAAQTVGIRENRPISAAERQGAAHTIVANIVKQNDPAAGLTQANGRVIPATTKRNFGGGVDSSY